jgi:arabinose-5-phosphate isomerase
LGDNGDIQRDHLPGARAVILTEAEGLRLLADGLGASFNQAVDLALASKGRIAVTGMGKSGHVARKVAATLSSTGSPAFFIHPTEAAHGDLGMLGAEGDIVLAFSNSGETEELSVILGYCARNRIPVIGVTAKPGSFLGAHSDVVIALPGLAEACPLGCAPTTSTTMMMAFGDALALSLLSARGFTQEDFLRYHPGGKLGSRLLKVGELMHGGDSMPLAAPGTPMGEALVTMTGKRLGCLGIVEGGALVGIITDGDLRRHVGPGLLTSKAGDVMTRGPVSFKPGDMAAKALASMRERGITNAFVLSPGGEPLGVIHIHDLLAAGV